MSCQAEYQVRGVETVEAYIARRRAARLDYLAPCPRCPERCAATHSRVKLEVLVTVGFPLDRVDEDGYVADVICGMCQRWKRAPAEAKELARKRAVSLEEQEREARLEAAERAEKKAPSGGAAPRSGVLPLKRRVYDDPI